MSFENAPKGSIDFPILSMSVRGRSEGFSRIDGSLESFRVARNARFRDRDAGATPKAGVGERGGDAGEGAAFKPGGGDTLANRACAMHAALVRG